MSYLPDPAVERLRRSLAEPDFSFTRYRLKEKLGRGGMGIVYLADDTELEREVAVKVLSTAASADLLAEARVLARLEHPGIVPVHDAGTLPDGRGYFVMKRVQGEPLGTAARPRNEWLRVLLRVCDAVAFAHSRGYVHRDLKPANIMTGAFGEVLVLDWGIAQAPEREAPAAGTPHYMAPEQARGETVDARADVYSLGVMLRELAPDPPAPLRSIVARATAPDPAARYASAEELRDDLARFLDHEKPAAHRETPLEAAARFARRHQLLLGLILTYLVVRAALFFWLRF